jgi:general stress protein 26
MAITHEQSKVDLSGNDAVDKVRHFAESVKFCMLTTEPLRYPPTCTPMTVQSVGSDGTLWFLTARSSVQSRGIVVEPRVVLTFQDSNSYRYLVVNGSARLHQDAATIHEHWTPFASAWFQGPDDPDLAAISVHPEHGHYWDATDGKLLTLAKISFAALTGARSVNDGARSGDLSIDPS